MQITVMHPNGTITNNLNANDLLDSTQKETNIQA